LTIVPGALVQAWRDFRAALNAGADDLGGCALYRFAFGERLAGGTEHAHRGAAGEPPLAREGEGAIARQDRGGNPLPGGIEEQHGLSSPHPQRMAPEAQLVDRP